MTLSAPRADYSRAIAEILLFLKVSICILVPASPSSGTDMSLSIVWFLCKCFFFNLFFPPVIIQRLFISTDFIQSCFTFRCNPGSVCPYRKCRLQSLCCWNSTQTLGFRAGWDLEELRDVAAAKEMRRAGRGCLCSFLISNYLMWAAWDQGQCEGRDCSLPG